MWRILLVHAVVGGLLAAGCSSRPTRVPETSAPATARREDGNGQKGERNREARYYAGAAVPGGDEERQEPPPPSTPPPPQEKQKQRWTQRAKRETRQALRETAKVGRDVLVGIAVGVGIVVGIAALIWVAGHSDND